MVGVSRCTACTRRHQFLPAARDQFGAGDRRRLLRGERTRHHGVAALGAAHRLHDIAEEARMQVAEEADEAAVVGAVHQHMRRIGLGEAAHHGDRRAGLVHRLEIPAVQLDAAVLARQHGVGLGARGDQDRARRQHDLRPIGTRQRADPRRGRIRPPPPRAGSGLRRNGPPPPAPSPPPRGSACRTDCRSAGGDRRS